MKSAKTLVPASFYLMLSCCATMAQNVGIGTTTPAEKLHVNNGNILHNNIDPTIQLQNTGVNNGFIQLAGNNISIGANSANYTRNFVIRNNGSDIVTVNADGEMGIGIIPNEKLDVGGNIELTGDIKKPGTGDISVLPLCYGKISSSGTILGGSGNFTVSKPAGTEGVYNITCTGLSTSSTVIVTPVPQPYLAPTQSLATATFSGGFISVITGLLTGCVFDEGNIYFHFIIYK